jgi:anti-sigma regulatory factor (Ser/Thr protein kinase)
VIDPRPGHNDVMRREQWLPATPESAAMARAFVRDIALENGLAACVDDLMLAASEAVTNAVLHGSPCSPHGILIAVEPADRSIEVEVCDCGTFIPRPGEPDPLGTNGRGLPLIAAVADQVELVPEPGRTMVRFTKNEGAVAA